MIHFSARVVLDGIRTGGAATRSYEGCDPVSTVVPTRSLGL